MTTSAPSWHLRDDQEELAERKNVPHIFHESSEALARNQEFGSGIWKAHSLLTSYRRQAFLILPSFFFTLYFPYFEKCIGTQTKAVWSKNF